MIIENALPKENLKKTLLELLVKHQELLKNYLNVFETREEISRKLDLKDLSNFSMSSFESLKEFVASIEHFKNSDKKLTEKGLLLEFIKRIGMRIPADCMDLITDSDVIEIYDTNAIQVYRGLNFFKITSYSLTDLLTNEWWNLYDRNVFITNSLGNRAVHMFTNNILETEHISLSSHETAEIWSTMQSKVTMTHLYFIPMFDDTKTIRGIITPIRIEKCEFTRPLTMQFS